MFVSYMRASGVCCSHSRTLNAQNFLQMLWRVLKCETRLYHLGDLGRRMCRDQKRPFSGVTGLITVVLENEAWTWSVVPMLCGMERTLGLNQSAVAVISGRSMLRDMM